MARVKVPTSVNCYMQSVASKFASSSSRSYTKATWHLYAAETVQS